MQDKADFSHVSIFSSPVLSLKTLARVIAGALKSCMDFVLAHWLIFLVTAMAVLTFATMPLPENLHSVSITTCLGARTLYLFQNEACLSLLSLLL